jgi:hypothetical protein
MGNNLFGANISGKLAAALGSKVLGLVLVVPGAPLGTDPNNPLGGTRRAPPRRIACRGFPDDQRLRLFDKKTIVAGDTAIAILGDTIAGGKVRPEPDHRIVFKGRELTVISTKSDPDDALYVCQCRG